MTQNFQKINKSKLTILLYLVVFIFILFPFHEAKLQATQGTPYQDVGAPPTLTPAPKEESKDSPEITALKLEVSKLNKLTDKDIDVSSFIGKLLGIVLQVIGAITLLMFIYGGVLWMTAQGGSDKIGRAIRILVWSSLGAIVVLMSATLVQFIFGIF